MSTPSQPLRYVLLWHDCPDDYRDGPHWDLMLQREGVQEEHSLATWSLLKLPAAWSGVLTESATGSFSSEPIEATKLTDHRAAYLEYEGPVSRGRGEVKRLAAGGLQWRFFEASRVEAELQGTLAGRIQLEFLCEDSWRLTAS